MPPSRIDIILVIVTRRRKRRRNRMRPNKHLMMTSTCALFARTNEVSSSEPS